MKYIDEHQIEAIITTWEDSTTYEKHLSQILENYPALGGFLMQESMDILTSKEKDMLWFIIATLMKACQECEVTISKEALEKIEEKNWDILTSNPKGSFYERVSPFYEDYPQEDLLSFIEDMSQVDGEDEVTTKIGRDVIFISAKTLLDLHLMGS